MLNDHAGMPTGRGSMLLAVGAFVFAACGGGHASNASAVVPDASAGSPDTAGGATEVLPPDAATDTVDGASPVESGALQEASPGDSGALPEASAMGSVQDA